MANREFFLANRKFVEAYPEIIDDLTKAVDEASIWAKQQPRAVAELLSSRTTTGIVDKCRFDGRVRLPFISRLLRWMLVFKL